MANIYSQQSKDLLSKNKTKSTRNGEKKKGGREMERGRWRNGDRTREFGLLISKTTSRQ